MPDLLAAIRNRRPLVVGAVGDPEVLRTTVAPEHCDISMRSAPAARSAPSHNVDASITPF
jgi:hypothetical protein